MMLRSDFLEQSQMHAISASSHNILFICLDGFQRVLSDGNALLHKHILPHSVDRQIFRLVHEHKTSGKIALDLGAVRQTNRLQQGCQNRLGGSAQSDRPAGDAVSVFTPYSAYSSRAYSYAFIMLSCFIMLANLLEHYDLAL